MPNTYTTRQGDMWDLIALRQMGSELYVDKLMAANILYREIVIFPAGIVLTIPAVKKVVGALLPPWVKTS